MEIKLKPIATVKNSRTTPTEAFEGIYEFSHLEIIYFFDKVNNKEIVFSGHPRGNPNYPLVGIFGQRKKNRPNTIGLCTVELLEHNARCLKVRYLDAIDGTPVLNIKPVFKEFQPKGEIRQPLWVSILMKNYWK